MPTLGRADTDEPALIMAGDPKDEGDRR